MKKKPPEHENLERWMVSYADFMTLLFALFVVLYAFAMAKQSDAKSIAESIAQAFNEASVVNSPGGALLVPGSLATQLAEEVQEAVKQQLDASQGDTGKQIIENGGVMMNFQTTSTVSQEERDDTTSGSDDERDGQNNADSATSAGDLVISENETSRNENPKSNEPDGGSQTGEGGLQAGGSADAFERGGKDQVDADTIGEGKVGTHFDAVRRSISETVSESGMENFIDINEDPHWLSININSGLLFAEDSASVLAASRPVIQKIAVVLSGINNYVRIRGYTDDSFIPNGIFRNSWDLSANRAVSVLNELEKSGINPERMAIEKLFLHQAKIDTVKVQDAMVIQQAESRINYFIANLGSREKVEEYFRKPLPELKEQMIEVIRNQYTVQEVQRNLTKDVKATPSDVRKYYATLPPDSIPYIPQQVEVKLLSLNPVIPQQEIDDVKARLRDFTNKINSGENEFSTLAILYSEDGSSMYGGEIGFKSRSELVPEFASVAFNLNDTKKVSKIVETEFGYHIIQLIEKRGDRINCRHILLKPKVAQKDLDEAKTRLDSIRKDMLDGKFTFEEATQWISQDKDTKNNKGIMVNRRTSSTKFEMADLPQEIAKVVDKMEVGDISEPFIMIDQSRNKEIVAIVKLSRRIEGHKANLSDDYQILKNMYENNRKAKIIDDWVVKKQKETYVRIDDDWRNCEFKYSGWIKK